MLYTVLRLINQLDCMDMFLQQGNSDMGFPFSLNTLPAAVQLSVQSQFIDEQSVVLV